ncbi:hypothetical protein C2E23DRAFT_888082 [Lenzites betulinus]|nr:hypothetical protein C2E23DRAFT_888082 [Lenzites betulinus]
MNRSHSHKRRQHASSHGNDHSHHPHGSPIPGSSEAWAACARALREFDEDMIQDWKEEIDTLLVFAGLFSAIVTAFNIESYKLLQQQPEDATVAILTQISAQLNSYTVNANFANTTRPTDTATLSPPFQASALAVRLNAWWFSALVCGLLSASLGLLVKQWLREYLAGASNISRESIRIRQYRYAGLQRWHVPEIILLLPLLLQTALILFFVGLLDFLWSLNLVVASVVTAFVAGGLVVAVMTTIAPPLYADCPYKSPQSWLLCTLMQSTKRTIASMAARFYGHLHAPRDDMDTLASKLDLPTIVHNKLSGAFRAWLYHVSLSRPFSSWKEREKTLTNNAAAALDDNTLASADATFMDDAFLNGVVRPCISDIEPHAALRCLDRILLRRAPRVIYGLPYWEFALDGGDNGTVTLMHLLLDVLHRLSQESTEDDTSDDARRHLLTTMHRLIRAIPGPGTSIPGDASMSLLLARTFEVLAGVINPGRGQLAAEPVRERAFHLMLKLFPRFQAVGPACIAAFCAYSKKMWKDNSPYRFVQSSCMVIRAAATLAHSVDSCHPPISPAGPKQAPTPYLLDDSPTPTDREDPSPDGRIDGYTSIRPALIGTLLDLEDFFSIPVSRAAERRPAMATLAECAEAAVALAGRDRQVITPGFVAALTDMVVDVWDMVGRPFLRPTSMDHPSYESLEEGKRVSASLWDNSGAWATCAKALGDHDEDMIRNWKEEIDTLLVLAGLFSAVVTTFNVEVYTMLQPQPEDMMVATLMQISTQLNSFVVNSNFVNSTQPMDSKALYRPFKADAVAIRLNIAWFLALVCGLLSASLGLLVKQWLREYLSGSSNVSRESMRIRQLRYESLRRWRVPEIILFLPILLQVGLLSFFVGLLDLLWTLHPVVAAVITTFVSIAMAIATVMAVLPPLFADCPYKSPQSWFVFSLIQSVKRLAISIAVPYYAHLRCAEGDLEMSSNLRNIPALVHNRLSRTMRGWLRQLTLHHTFSSWKERERAVVKNAAPVVDDAILSGADAIFMDDSFLHNVIRPCLDDIEPNNALRCLDRILLQRAPSIIHGFPYWDFALSTGDRGTIALLDPLLDVLHRLNQLESDHEDVDESRRRVLVTMHRIVRAIPGPTVSQPHDKQTCALLRRTFEVLAGVINPPPAHAIVSPVVCERAFHLMLKLFPRFQSVGTTCK